MFIIMLLFWSLIFDIQVVHGHATMDWRELVLGVGRLSEEVNFFLYNSKVFDG